MRRIATPLLVEVGERSMDGRLSIADEHLVSAMVRNLLGSIMRSRGQSAHPAVLLATPSGERHEFGLLLAALHVLEAGLGVCYLGVDLPADQIVAAARRTSVTVVGLGVVDGGNRERAVAELHDVERTLPTPIELWLGGRDAAAVARLAAPTAAFLLDEITSMERETRRLSSVTAARA